jgi:hypothetical protein
MQILIDIQQKLEHDFGSEFPFARDEIDAIYIATNWNISNKVIRSIIYLAKGNLELLNKNIQRAQTDFKDLLWEAEYDRGDEQLRDFSKSFIALGLI